MERVKKADSAAKSFTAVRHSLESLVTSDILPLIQSIDKGELDEYVWKDGKWLKLSRTQRVRRNGGAESTRSQDIRVIRIGYMASGQHYPNSDILVSNYIVTRILEYEILMLLK